MDASLASLPVALNTYLLPSPAAAADICLGLWQVEVASPTGDLRRAALTISPVTRDTKPLIPHV